MPDLNPDGHAAKRRTNARGVDLNRNFPGTWRDLATSRPAPGPEVETRLAMRLIRRLRPDVTIWFHQPQDLVRATGPERRRRATVRSARPHAVPPAPAAARLGDRLAARGAARARASFVVELPPGELGILEAGRWTHAVLELAGRLLRDAHDDLASFGLRRRKRR